MEGYIKAYEQELAELRSRQPPVDPVWLCARHRAAIEFLQQERLAHLLVTLAFALFLLTAVGATLVRPELAFPVLALLLLVVEAFYVIHYFRLENAVQRWYRVYDELSRTAAP